MILTKDLKELWDEAKARGLTFAKAAELLRARGYGSWGTSTVRDCVMGHGKEMRANLLRRTLIEFLGKTESAKDGRAESADSGVGKPVDRPDNLTLEQWRRRAIFAEEKLQQLQANLRAALSLSEAPMPPISSKPPSEGQRIAKSASAYGKRAPGE